MGTKQYSYKKEVQRDSYIMYYTYSHTHTHIYIHKYIHTYIYTLTIPYIKI